MPSQFQTDLQQAQQAKQRYQRSGGRTTLDATAAAWERILRCPTFPASDERFQLAVVNDTGGFFLRRYWVAGQLADLIRALELYQTAVQRTPPDSPDLAARLNNLGTGLRDRYARSGALADLEEAIRVHQTAVQRTPPDSPDLPGYLSNLGNGLRDRYARTGALADLEEAIRVHQTAVQRTPPDSPDLPSRLNNLGVGLHDRYARTGALADLEEAFSSFQTAVQRTPPDSLDLPSLLINLGNGLRDRYARTGALADLEEAFSSYETAVRRTPPDSPDLAARLNNLGTGLSDRYARTGALADLEEAIRVHQTAVQRTPPDSTDLPSHLINLGNGLRDRYARTGALADLEEARERYRVACRRGMEMTPEEALRSARNWGNWALERCEWQEAKRAYAFGRQAIDLLFATQFSRAAKESWLKEAQGLPANTAYAMARLDQPEKAVEALEAGRARLLAEALEQNRRNLEQLEALGHKAVLDRYRTASERVTALQQQASQPATQFLRNSCQSPNQPVTQFDYTAWRQQLEQARAELNASIDAIRQVPGYQDFFLPPTFAKIQQAATPDAPLVYLATTPAGSVALVVRAPSRTSEVSETSPVSALWLDSLNETTLRAAIYGPADDPALGGYLGAYDSWQRNPRSHAARHIWHAALDQVTRWLWDTTMSPVVAHLAPPSADGAGAARGASGNAPHATLIPTGLLALLPLHAVWTEDPSTPTGRRYALDTVTFRYAPSAGALSQSLAGAALPADGLLAVDNPDGSLIFSRQEVEAVRSYFPPGQTTVLAGAKATRQAVLDQLSNRPIYHISTHGWAGWSDPLVGGLLLAGGQPLTLADILDLRLAGARLAILSACETGVPGTQLPDEVVSLPTGLMQAGVAGVVASLWAVNDLSTAMLMERFYGLWREEGLVPAEALATAQRWLRDSTNQELAAYFEQDVLLALQERMPPEVAAHLAFDRLRREPAARDFAHPIWWAAFTMTGA